MGCYDANSVIVCINRSFQLNKFVFFLIIPQEKKIVKRNIIQLILVYLECKSSLVKLRCCFNLKRLPNKTNDVRAENVHIHDALNRGGLIDIACAFHINDNFGNGAIFILDLMSISLLKLFPAVNNTIAIGILYQWVCAENYLITVIKSVTVSIGNKRVCSKIVHLIAIRKTTVIGIF